MRVFFENVACDNCGATLGFIPSELVMGSFASGDDGQCSRLVASQSARRPCANFTRWHVCNWMVRADTDSELCCSCATTEIVPGLDKPLNVERWARLEQAKRRMIYGLLALGLEVRSKSDAPGDGISLRFLNWLQPTKS